MVGVARKWTGGIRQAQKEGRQGVWGGECPRQGDSILCVPETGNSYGGWVNGGFGERRK